MIDHCPDCRVRLESNAWKSAPERLRVGEPWSPNYQLWRGRCPKCNQFIRAVLSSYESPRLQSWIESKQKLKVGMDYRIIYAKKHQLFNASLPLDILWNWHPLPNNEDWSRKSSELLGNMCRPNRNVIMVVGPDMPVVETISTVKSVQEIWRLEPHVLQGALGPHPSLRAELSLWSTFEYKGLENIYHCWPAITLDKRFYTPNGSNRDMNTAWAVYQRKNIEFGAKKKDVI